MGPLARHDRLLDQEIGDELIVYDRDTEKVHSLNSTSALVWRHCDGETSVADLAVLLHRELDLPADEDLVWLALRNLNRARLLVAPFERPGTGIRPTRRQVIQKLGLAGGLALLLPVVTSITAPTPAMAQSEVIPCGPGGTCPPGFVCDPATNTCFASLTPCIPMFTAGATITCDANSVAKGASMGCKVTFTDNCSPCGNGTACDKQETFAWSVKMGPGQVTINPTNAADVTVTGTLKGTLTLRAQVTLLCNSATAGCRNSTFSAPEKVISVT